jgi:hypothetical protein
MLQENNEILSGNFPIPELKSRERSEVHFP